jgi:hypothetical protein
MLRKGACAYRERVLDERKQFYAFAIDANIHKNLGTIPGTQAM